MGFATLYVCSASYKNIIQKSFFEYQDRVLHCTPFLKGSALKQYLKCLNSRRLNIQHIGPGITNRDLEIYFQRSFGPIENAYILNRKEITKQETGNGFVVFKHVSHSKAALREMNHFISGFYISVSQFESKKSQGSQKQKTSRKKQISENPNKVKSNEQNSDSNKTGSTFSNSKCFQQNHEVSTFHSFSSFTNTEKKNNYFSTDQISDPFQSEYHYLWTQRESNRLATQNCKAALNHVLPKARFLNKTNQRKASIYNNIYNEISQNPNNNFQSPNQSIYMNTTQSGFYDKNIESFDQFQQYDVQFIKAMHEQKKRKIERTLPCSGDPNHGKEQRINSNNVAHLRLRKTHTWYIKPSHRSYVKSPKYLQNHHSGNISFNLSSKNENP